MTRPSYLAEYRDTDDYGLNRLGDCDRIFFSHYYDEATLQSRIFSELQELRLLKQEWLGERKEGIFDDYIEKVRSVRFWKWAAFDYQDYRENYTFFSTQNTMPGVGVAGLAFQRPLAL
jgi:hypothetical protein